MYLNYYIVFFLLYICLKMPKMRSCVLTSIYLCEGEPNKSSLLSPSVTLQELIQTSSPSMTSVSSSGNPSGSVLPAGGLQHGSVTMTSVNSQVVSGNHVIAHLLAQVLIKCCVTIQSMSRDCLNYK